MDQTIQIRCKNNNISKSIPIGSTLLDVYREFNLNIPLEPYYLLIDEAQDLNLVQHQFIDNSIAQGFIQKWVAVGDRRQAIYGFSGSFASSFDVFKVLFFLFVLMILFLISPILFRKSFLNFDVFE